MCALPPGASRTEPPSRRLLDRGLRSSPVARKCVSLAALLRDEFPAGVFPPFFFRRRDCRFFHAASAADFLIDRQQLLRELAELLIGCHLAPRLLQFGGRGKGLCMRLSSHLAGEAKVRTMPWLIRLMAMTGR